MQAACELFGKDEAAVLKGGTCIAEYTAPLFSAPILAAPDPAAVVRYVRGFRAAASACLLLLAASALVACYAPLSGGDADGVPPLPAIIEADPADGIGPGPVTTNDAPQPYTAAWSNVYLRQDLGLEVTP